MKNVEKTNKKVGMLSLVASSMFCNAEGKISVVKCLVVAAVVLAIAVMPMILIELAAFAVVGVIAYWLGSAFMAHPKMQEMITSLTTKESEDDTADTKATA